MSQIRYCKCDGCGKTRQYQEEKGEVERIKESIGWVNLNAITVNGEGFAVQFGGDFCSLGCMADKLNPKMFKRM